MGLDQYGFARKGEEQLDIAYWRKHANLEGWMARLYVERGGVEEEFNCTELRLFADDLLALEQQYQNLTLASGFFWGESQDEDDATTRAFIEDAKSLMDDGYEIIYTSWW
tara:strand:- start:27 stop:356 length:330 start_codon:yes stop_codon:yes gene_type:complete